MVWEKDGDTARPLRGGAAGENGSFQGEPIPIRHYPTAGQQVYLRKHGRLKSLELGKEVAAGGEGFIYETSQEGLVAKIFRQEKLDTLKERKIGLMTEQNITRAGICFPQASLYNQENKFVGYLMPRAQGVELQRSLFLPPVFKKLFPDWKKKDVVQLGITILENIRYLHDHDILLGDINPGNILVVSSREVYFVDTDSYQIAGFPCPVGSHNFIAPEIQGRNFRTFLRTRGNENFAIATLLFMMLLPGQKPYARRGSGGDLLENIRNMDFAYELQGGFNEAIPNGSWGLIWSQLNISLRSAFYHTFHESGLHNCEATRYDPGEWLQRLKNYLVELELNRLGGQDPLLEEVFPRTGHQASQAPEPSAILSKRKPAAAQSPGPGPNTQRIQMYGWLDVTEDAQKLISGLYYARGCTTAAVSKILRGNQQALIEAAKREGVEGDVLFKLFGSLKHLSVSEINHLADYLVFEEYLLSQKGRGRRLNLAEKGQPYVLELVG